MTLRPAVAHRKIAWLRPATCRRRPQPRPGALSRRVSRRGGMRAVILALRDLAAAPDPVPIRI